MQFGYIFKCVNTNDGDVELLYTFSVFSSLVFSVELHNRVEIQENAYFVHVLSFS